MQAWKYPLPGDAVVTTIQRVVLDLDGPRVVRLKMPADQHRSSLCDDVKCRGGEWADVQWAAEGSQLAFVSTSRDHRKETFRIANATTGEVRDVIKENVADLLRKRQRPRQLELPGRDQRTHLVQRAR